jgi:hypothetical protein
MRIKPSDAVTFVFQHFARLALLNQLAGRIDCGQMPIFLAFGSGQIAQVEVIHIYADLMPLEFESIPEDVCRSVLICHSIGLPKLHCYGPCWARLVRVYD